MGRRVKEDKISVQGRIAFFPRLKIEIVDRQQTRSRGRGVMDRVK
jgi:hypothetical protein